MDCSVYLRRVVAVLLCCVLAFHSALPVARAAEPVSASLSIAAGAIALGGLSAAAVESTIGPQVAAIIGTTMEGLGTSTYVAEDSALTKTEFIMKKIALWSVQAKMAKEDFYKTVAGGISVAGNGVIQLTHDASNLISQFISWLYASGEVVESVTTDSFTLNLDDYSFPLMALDAKYSIESNNSEYSYFCVPNNSNNLSLLPIFMIVCSDGCIALSSNYSNGSYPSKRYYNADMSKYYASGGYFGSISHYAWSYANISGLVISNPTFPGTISEFIHLFREKYGDASIIQDAHDEVFTGNPATWEENKDLLNPSIDDVTTITPDLINKLIEQLAEGQVATMGISTYLDSLVAAFDGLRSQVAELTDAVTGAKTNVAVPESISTDVGVEPVNPISVPAVDPVELTPGGTIEGFSFPLDEIFPFCIPFDVVAAIQLFDVPPEAPALHVHWELPYNIVFDFDIDLSGYEDVAAVLRLMETILFAVGLAVATRSLFIRS